MEAEDNAGTPMFAIFLISLMSLFLVPFTIYRLCNLASGEAAKPWETAEKRKEGKVASKLRGLLKPTSIALVAGWILLFGLLFYVQQFAKELSPFDPFDILKIERSATDQDVKKAYRRLSLQYHPDKNQDPKAVPIFLQISQAYRALTDEEARKNWEKFGHPDGKQAMDLGIAIPLPTDGKNGPIILALLVFIGLILPMGLAAWFLFSSSKYMGPNQIMQETLNIFLRSKFGVKESQSLARIPDTLVYAMEFITMATPPEQQRALDDLRLEVLRMHPELKDKAQWFKRKTAIVKVHMLLLAHMDRVDIPPILHKDLDFVLKKSSVLLEEIVKIANIPRYSPYGWLTPSIGAVEMLQCLTQAVSIGSRKSFTQGKAGSDSQAPMLQLPHMGMDVIKRLGRKKVRGLGELLDMPEQERLSMLEDAGLTGEQATETTTALMSIPVVTINSADFLVEGEDGADQILEEDIVTCALNVVLKRPSHQKAGAVPPKGSSVLAYAPHCPVPREERWYVILADAAHNVTLSWNTVSLSEAECAGLTEATVSGQSGASSGLEAKANGSSASQAGQVVELKFRAPRQGKYDLTLYVLSDCWIGCDRIQAMKLKVNELTRAEREGRTHRGKVVPAAEAVDENGEEAAKEEEGSDEEEEASGSDEDWDSEEEGTEESGSDEEEEAEKKEEAKSSDGESSTTEAPLLQELKPSQP